MMEHTLTLAERTGEKSDWVRRAGEAKQALTASVQAEQAALAKLPYSRADLEKALEDLAHKKPRAPESKAGRPAGSAP
jgi:hypothetical protein